jgi:hypothetical protein
MGCDRFENDEREGGINEVFALTEFYCPIQNYIYSPSRPGVPSQVGSGSGGAPSPPGYNLLLLKPNCEEAVSKAILEQCSRIILEDCGSYYRIKSKFHRT